MSPFFEDVERDLVAAAQRRADLPLRRRASRGSALLIAMALVLGAGSTTAAATYYVLRDSPIAPFGPDDATPEQAVEPGTSRVLDLRAPDPSGDAPPWALRLSRSRAGLLCGTVGQVDDREFGLVGLDNRFRGIPEPNADSCGDDVEGDATLLGVRVFGGQRDEDVRTVLSGVVKGLERVSVASGGGSPRLVEHSPEGGFLVAMRGYPEDTQPEVTLRLAGGKVRRHAFARDPFVVPDPLGARAWKLVPFMIGVETKPGRKSPKVTYRPTCVQFQKARPERRLANPVAPAVCGVSTPFFAARRLSGRRDTGDPLIHGRWSGHAPRTAVYGSARKDQRVVVTAPGVRATTRATVNGSFLVVLSPKVDPRAVRVQIDRRRYGSTHATVKDPRPR